MTILNREGKKGSPEKTQQKNKSYLKKHIKVLILQKCSSKVSEMEFSSSDTPKYVH
jgi:hypothetical protein